MESSQENQVIVVKKAQLQKLNNLIITNTKNFKKNNEIDEKFVSGINKINESNLSIEQSMTEIEVDEYTGKPGKKRETIKFNVIDLQQLNIIGSGASGQVYLLKHKKFNKYLALKVIPYKNDEKLKGLIEREVKLLSECHCENLIRCYATYFDNYSVKFVLEFMNKGTLADVLKITKIIPEQALGIISNQILKGLDYLHREKNVVHRDIKPSNILLNSYGFAKISDLGISREIETDKKNNDLSFIGTYTYMSPERIMDSKYDCNSDIWSVGMSILECALGFHPIEQIIKIEKLEGVFALINIINNCASPFAPADQFSPEFCDFINQTLIKDPLLRPNSSDLLSHPFITNYENGHYALAKWFNMFV